MYQQYAQVAQVPSTYAQVQYATASPVTQLTPATTPYVSQPTAVTLPATYQTANVVTAASYMPVQNNAVSSLQYNGMNNFTLISCGNGISQNESACIKRAAFEGLQSGANPLSNFVAKRIKELLNGDWLAVCYDVSNPKDFSLTTVRSSDFMVFTIGNIKFEICRTREMSDITQSYGPQAQVYQVAGY